MTVPEKGSDVGGTEVDAGSGGTLVSVVVPVHDAGPHLAEALASVVAQDLADDVAVEVIVVDDGSTDGAVDAVVDARAVAAPAGEDRAGEDRAADERAGASGTVPEVRVLRQDNRGPSAARNAGVAAARGQVVAFLDADDTWPPHKLRNQLRHLDDSASEVSLGHQRLHLDGLDEVPAWMTEQPAWMPHAWRDRVQGQIPLSSMVVRREVLDRVGPFADDLRHAEDVDWVLRAFELGVPLAVLDEVVLERRLHPGNASADTAAMQRGMLAALGRRAGRVRAAAEAEATPTPTPTPPRVSVVIPLRHHADLLDGALASVAAQGDAVAEVVAVDDGSPPADAEVIAETCRAHGVRWVRQAPSGAAVGRNLGARLASGTHLLFLDADDLLGAGAVAALVAALGGGDPDGSNRGALGITEEFLDGVPTDTRAPVTTRARLLGAMVLPRSLFLALGGFDESLGRGEAIDLLHRATQAGLELVDVDTVVLRRRLHAANGGQGSGTADYLTVAHQAIQRLRAARP